MAPWLQDVVTIPDDDDDDDQISPLGPVGQVSVGDDVVHDEAGGEAHDEAVVEAVQRVKRKSSHTSVTPRRIRLRSKQTPTTPTSTSPKKTTEAYKKVAKARQLVARGKKDCAVEPPFAAFAVSWEHDVGLSPL